LGGRSTCVSPSTLLTSMIAGVPDVLLIRMVQLTRAGSAVELVFSDPLQNEHQNGKLMHQSCP
jgi:hypothetical protein